MRAIFEDGLRNVFQLCYAPPPAEMKELIEKIDGPREKLRGNNLTPKERPRA